DLAVRLHRSIELAAIETPAPDHRLDLAGAVLDRDQRPFDDRRLLERDGQKRARVVDLSDLDLDEISGLEEVRRRRAPRPGEALARQIRMIAADAKPRGAGRRG